MSKRRIPNAIYVVFDIENYMYCYSASRERAKALLEQGFTLRKYILATEKEKADTKVKRAARKKSGP